MFLEMLEQHAVTILGVTVGGVSLATILGLGIYFVKQFRKVKKNIDTFATEASSIVETGFKSIVLPQKIKLDISNKIERPIQEGFNKLQQSQSEQYGDIKEALFLTLSILSKFKYANQLTDDEKLRLDSLLGKVVEEEVQL